MHYTPLYIKTDASLLKSLIKIDDLIEYALKNKLTSLALTDENMYNAIEFYEKCRKNKIKPIIGLEVTIDKDILLLYAETEKGYRNLIKITTIKSERELTLKDIKEHYKDLLCILPYQSKKREEELEPYFKNLWIGYQTEEEKKHVKEKGIFLQEKLCFEKKDKYYLPYLEAIRVGTLKLNIEEKEGNFSFEIDPSLLSENNYKIEKLCNVEIKKEKNLLPIYPCPENQDSYTYLKKLCITSLKEKFGEKAPLKYVERLKYELSVIKEMDFCNYFLVVWDYIKYAKNHNIYVGPGRGSAAGSLVSYLLHITEIDPIYYNLLFERFLNPERITMPDIDIDFEDTKREEMITYCIKKYGQKKVAPIITFGTLKAKQAIRDVARSIDINTKIVDAICHLINPLLTLRENYNQNIKLKTYIEKDLEIKKMYQIALKLEGLKRHSSIHAAGIIMCNKDIDEVIPLDFHDDFYLTGYTMDYLEELGLLKMDFLAITTLSTLHDIKDDIEKNEQIKLPMYQMDFHDEKTLEIFRNADTTCIFQFESEGMKNFLRKFKPKDFEEIVATIALYRPGPMGNIDNFIARKRGKEKIDYFHQSLEEVLKPTYGIIVYQEQIMQIASIMAGYSYGEADILRRAMSKKKESVLLKEKDKFINQSIKKGYTKELSQKIYELILKFASYGFNRAHSVSYVMIAYNLAYLKAHYRIYFMKNLLGASIGNEKKTREYLYECKSNNINIKEPDLNKSENKYKIEDNNLILPFTIIKGVGPLAGLKIIEERQKQPFKDIYDFISRVYGGAVNRKVLEALIYAGVLNCFSANTKMLINNLDALINYAEITKDLSEEFTLKPEIIEGKDFSKKEKLEKEKELYGFYISAHPITEYKLKYKEVIPLEKVPLYFDKIISTFIYVEKVKEITTKKEEKMAFITGADEIENIDVVFFPRVYEKKEIKIGDILYITAKVEKRFDKYQLIVNSFQKKEEEKA